MAESDAGPTETDTKTYWPEVLCYGPAEAARDAVRDEEIRRLLERLDRAIVYGE